jgi:bifunctional non-homologous end joining protein LigD
MARSTNPAGFSRTSYDGLRILAKIQSGKPTLHSRNGRLISRNYIGIAKALEVLRAMR